MKAAASLVAVLAIGAVGAFAAEHDATSFTILVSTSTSGVELRCTSGCAWTTVQHACRPDAPCWLKVDERGLDGQPRTESQPGTKPFRLLVTVGGSGFSMQCKAGCGWKSVTYRCTDPTQTCHATVDKSGVRGAQPATTQ
jgi:hypothetical protein